MLPAIAVAVLVLAPIVAGYAVPTLDWLDYPKGVRGPARASPESFAESFWPSLYSGLIAGAITGIVIGMALVVAELRVASNRARSDHRDALAGFFGDIEPYLLARKRVDFIPVSAADAAPFGAERVVQEARDKPLYVWWELFPDYQKPLYHLAWLRRLYVAFTYASEILDEALDIAAREFLRSCGRQFDDERAEAIRRYAISKVLGADEDIIIVKTARILDSDELAEAFDYIMKQERYVKVVGEYQKALDALQAALNSLAALVTTIPESGKTDASAEVQTAN